MKQQLYQVFDDSENTYLKAKERSIPFDKRDLEHLTALARSLNKTILYGNVRNIQDHNRANYGLYNFKPYEEGKYNFRQYIYPPVTNVIKICQSTGGLGERSGWYAYIYKNEDDWFYVAARSPRGYEHTYKCDQMDGLNNLLLTVFR